MTRWTDHNDTERMVMLQQAADAEGLPEYAVEKDWWVTMVLKAMFQTSVAEWLEFKGGTSLSKGWRLIDRFSEDIDLALSYRFFTEKLENNNQLKMLRKRCRRFVVGTLADELHEQMLALGLKEFEVIPEVADEAGNMISTDADPTVIYVNYRSVANAHSWYMPSRVKVEVSCLSMDEPFEVKEFGTMISSVFPDDDEDAMVSIPTVLPSRTFLEKAFLLCEEFQKPQPRSLRMSRHLYDLERLMDTEFGKAALEDDELYGKIVEHRRKFYHVGYADYDKDYRERISFLPPESCIEAWRADYDELLMHFVYGNKLSFDELLERVNELNRRFNGLNNGLW